MRSIRIILMVVGFWMNNVYGASPEFYGIYADNNGKLIEMVVDDKNKTPLYDFDPKVRFLVYQMQAEMYANELKIERAIFVRTVNNPGLNRRQPPKNVNTWKTRGNGTIETRAKPVAGQPQQIYVVPRSPLPAGMYFVKVGGKEIGKFFVDQNRVTQNLEQGEDCIDIVVEGGWASYGYDLDGSGGKATPCSAGGVGRNAAEIRAVGFKNNGNGTVTDNDKKLMWQQAQAGDSLEWEAAIGYCKSLTLSGYNDWRLPSRDELGSILQQDKTYFLTASCPSCPGYWTSSSDEDESWAWQVNLARGDSGSSKKKSWRGYARCVRGG